MLCLAGGAASGLATPPGDWYRSLAKPDWTPPPWLFGPVWTLLYLMIGVAGWMLWRARREPHGPLPFALFVIQLALNFAWTPVFFGLQAPGAALAVIALLLLAIAVTIALAWRVRMLAGMLLVPYLLWVSFAAALNLAIWRLN
ncbi:MAG: TspO/MBR family protein [Planctomycetota bacterium]